MSKNTKQNENENGNVVDGTRTTIISDGKRKRKNNENDKEEWEKMVGG